jgi:hypothetical protein
VNVIMIGRSVVEKDGVNYSLMKILTNIFLFYLFTFNKFKNAQESLHLHTEFILVLKVND